jgi:hypothetical protein
VHAFLILLCGGTSVILTFDVFIYFFDLGVPQSDLEFQSQTSPLRPSDLVQTYLLLRAAREAGKHLFAFYNCA